MTVNQPIVPSEINAILWKACDTFRGTVDPSEYKNYILVMLFVKYISDLWQEKLAQYQEQYNGDEERIQRRLSREKFRLPPTATFQALYAQRTADNLGEVINMALEAIEEANREKLQGVFRNIDFNSEAALDGPRSATRASKICSTISTTPGSTCAPAALATRM